MAARGRGGGTALSVGRARLSVGREGSVALCMAVVDGGHLPLLHLGDELWTEHVLPHVGASELVRLQRVCKAARRVVVGAKHLQATVTNEKARRGKAQAEDRARRKGARYYEAQNQIGRASCRERV